MLREVPPCFLGDLEGDLALGEAQPPMPEGWRGVQPHHDVPDMHLVQFTGPTQARWLEQLETAGAQVVQYIHPYTYIVWGQANAIDQVRDGVAGVENVRAAGEFSPGFRVLPQWRNLPQNPIDVHFMIYRGADVGAVIDQVVALGNGTVNTSRQTMDDTFEVAAFTMPGSLFQQASRLGVDSRVGGGIGRRGIGLDGRWHYDLWCRSRERRGQEEDQRQDDVEPERRCVGDPPATQVLRGQQSGPEEQRLERAPDAMIGVEKVFNEFADHLRRRVHMMMHVLAAAAAVLPGEYCLAIQASVSAAGGRWRGPVVQAFPARANRTSSFATPAASSLESKSSTWIRSMTRRS